MKVFPVLVFCFMISSCGQETTRDEKPDTMMDTLKARIDTAWKADTIVKNDSVIPVNVGTLEKELLNSGLVDVQRIDSTIRVELRYSGTNNFLGMDVYGDLDRCYLQPDVAGKLAMAQKKLREKHPGYSLLIYDGVRPLHIQQIMWDTIDVPVTERTKYLSNPDPAKGSLHNYGAAVDLTICDADGKPLDMGTDFDFFGELAYPTKEKELLDAGKLNTQQIANRKLLRSVMYAAGFFGIQTEWWHFNSVTRDSASKIYRIVN
ncbi:MAG TPA: M15 family metallopeptidase [Bacteroidia bacterium]|jgi:D-alanyl-D-alanine dipeptidase|nr:M15 family metallopeptidase [Bacteroidia bacterium]